MSHLATRVTPAGAEEPSSRGHNLTARQHGRSVETATRTDPLMGLVRWLLPVGWLLACAGYYGPWIDHKTSALTLSGVEMGEFVKFLPGALDGSLKVVRQMFYLPPFAVAVGIGLLIGVRRLNYPAIGQALGLVLAVPVSLQLLPPAWSPIGLVSSEFRVQTLLLAACWFVLAGFWLWDRLPLWLNGGLSLVLALASGVLAGWQFWLVRPAIAAVYGATASLGWGLALCAAGLAVMATASGILASRR